MRGNAASFIYFGMDDKDKWRFHYQMSDMKSDNPETAFKLTDKTVFSELPEAEKARIAGLLENAKVEFKRQAEEAERNFFKFLFAVNSGAAIAFLAFLDKSAQGTTNSAAIWPLSVFSSGVVFVGIALMINSYGLRQTTVSHIKNAAAFTRDELPLLELHRRTSPKSIGACVIDALCVFSFIGFIVGCVLAYRVLHLQIH
jgi:hypothetical protein